MVKLFRHRQPEGADTVKLHVSLSQPSTREIVGLPGSGLHYITPIKPHATAPVPHPGTPQLLSRALTGRHPNSPPTCRRSSRPLLSRVRSIDSGAGTPPARGHGSPTAPGLGGSSAHGFHKPHRQSPRRHHAMNSVLPGARHPGSSRMIRY